MSGTDPNGSCGSLIYEGRYLQNLDPVKVKGLRYLSRMEERIMMRRGWDM